MAKLNIEDPLLLTRKVQEYLNWQIAGKLWPPPFRCEVMVVLGGNIVRNGQGYMTTTYEKGTKKSFGAQGRVITAALLYHLGVSDCLLLSTGKTDPQDEHAPSEASVMKAELLAYGVPEACLQLEEHSRTTEENARELARLFATRPLREKKTIGVITSSWHIKRTDAFFSREGVKGTGRVIKYISSDTMIGRYFPEFRNDIHLIYRSQDMRERIRDEHNGYLALKNGIYRSRQLGERVAEVL